MLESLTCGWALVLVDGEACLDERLGGLRNLPGLIGLETIISSAGSIGFFVVTHPIERSFPAEHEVGDNADRPNIDRL